MSAEDKIKEDIKSEILGIILIAFSALCYISLLSQKGGNIGRFLSKILEGLTGKGAVLFPFLIMVFGVMVIIFRSKFNNINTRFLGIMLIFLAILTFLHIPFYEQNLKELSFVQNLKNSIDLGIEGKGGGFIGGILTIGFYKLFGMSGIKIVLSAVILIGFLLTVNTTITSLIKAFLKILYNLFLIVKNNVLVFVLKNLKENSEENIPVIEPKELNISNTEGQIQVHPQTKSEMNSETEDNDTLDIKINGVNEKISDYKLPPLSILKKDMRKKTTITQKELLNNAKTLENTLKSFGVDAKVIQVNCGPAVTKYEIQPTPGTKVSKIVSLTDDIALSLAAPDVRIEAPIPGKAAVGIEIPNKQISLVHCREVIETKAFKESKSKLTIALGKDITGNPVVADLSQMPHLLIAGATGSGKSVCINTIIISILYKASPYEVKMLLIDPKVVELTTYNGIPHLLTPVITDAKKAASALNWVVSEMENRYRKFAKTGVRDIQRYNEKINENTSLMPQIVVIIDELSDLMMVAPADVEDAICRLAQMARAAGIHLVVATQRPSVDVITGVIKANIPSRISFAVSSQTDSRTILDMNGAEKLLGKGDMLFYPVGFSKPKRIQGTYITEKEVEEVVKFIKKQGEHIQQEEIVINEEPNTKNSSDVDELFVEALKLIVDTGQASISLLQRRLHIGYTRAARLIDQMEEHGYIGGYEGTKPRQVLISKQQFDKYFNFEKTKSGSDSF